MKDQGGSWIQGISTIGIPVTDQVAALGFYRDILGFDVLVDAPMPGTLGRWIMLAPHGSEVSISLVLADTGMAVGVQTGIRFSTGDVEATYLWLNRHHVPVGELLRWPGVLPMFQAQDPDGNRFEVIEVPR
ncbi:VOC family protein [Paeniglutamicibacter cryotolerans]|uniref:Catechol 2,3-dioxygenase-like lactoylglutathione lyase family enzyme n=1 Tax=Paeniglutamicibacter cryotolerans TaxID=670079 RepID=A0A839QXV0_9MICC|nr:VOC family protein [Paeniglutamicibacter cryotolerans]MBB2996791.1 catechol 2,3-dioxygenase-like lactoylglutathione lyase family enzyme [Paeniglutamicibacter cryotolerans]